MSSIKLKVSSRSVKWLAFGLIGIFAGALVFQEAMLKYLSDETNREQSLRARHLETFLADHEALRNVAVFAPAARTKDAGPFLNAKMPWYLEENGPSRYLAGVTDSPIPLPEAIKKEFSVPNEQWLGKIDTFDYSRFDLSWMKTALQFDHWDLHDNSPLRQSFEKSRVGKRPMLNYLTGLPNPHLIPLVHLAKIRLMKGLKEGKPKEAFSEVRHLARLVYTTEDLASELLTIAVLGAERVVYDYAVAHGRMRKSDWEPLPADKHEKAKRVVFGAGGYFSPLTPPDMLQRVFGEGAPGVGTCAGIREGTILAASVERHLNTYIPLERDFRPTYRALQKIALNPANGCRLSDIRTYWKDPSAFGSWGFESPSEFWEAAQMGTPWIWLSMVSHRLPYVRKATGVLLGTIGTPTAFRRYETTAK